MVSIELATLSSFVSQRHCSNDIHIVIPPEIKKKGKRAVEVYKEALREGKQKIPRCNLLLLGEERTGKTSVYRQLVGKPFNPDQDSTMGIDNTVVETVDTRNVASDTWEEKSHDDQKKQSEDLLALGVVKVVKKKLPFRNSQGHDAGSPRPITKSKLIETVKRIERKLHDIESESKRSHELTLHPSSYQDRQSSYSSLKEAKSFSPLYFQPISEETDSKPERKKVALGNEIKVQKDAKPKGTPESHRIESTDVQKATATAETSTDTQLKGPGETPRSKQVSRPNEDASKKKESVPTESNIVRLSRGHSKQISKLMKGDVDDQKEIPLTYNALDFAGQKEYHPMHHCFITRRAIYLVVFDLQKMLKYIKGNRSSDDNPLEQIRYWLHSIHAHVFPPNKGDHMRRVCLVGTHRSPKESEEVTEEQLNEINEELKKALECDDRCVSHLHYTSKPERMFVAVENSMDSKEDREVSGILQLQNELTKVSDKLTFLKEDFPIIWLNFEAQLIKACNSRKQKGLSVVVPVQEVLGIASRQGIEEDQHLVLEFFHDTGKIICLSKLNSDYTADFCTATYQFSNSDMHGMIRGEPSLAN